MEECWMVQTFSPVPQLIQETPSFHPPKKLMLTTEHSRETVKWGMSSCAYTQQWWLPWARGKGLQRGTEGRARGASVSGGEMEGVSYNSALCFGYQTQPWDPNTETLAMNGIFFFLLNLFLSRISEYVWTWFQNRLLQVRLSHFKKSAVMVLKGECFLRSFVAMALF